jgi:D-alanyl-D-alanine carboxypeptidase
MLRSLLLLLALPGALAAPLPACTYEDRPAALTDYSDWPYTLLDTIYALPESYAPGDLVPVTEAGVGADTMKVRSMVMPDLRALLRAAEAAGVRLEVQSAYRSYSYQEMTFTGWVAQDGLGAALKTSARPGHSEHQLGTALDFRSADGPPAWELADWRETPEGAWLADNALRFGFVMSYPEGKEAVTCYSYEPWQPTAIRQQRRSRRGQASGLSLRECSGIQ